MEELKLRPDLQELVTGDHFVLTKLPMPPSSNKQYWAGTFPKANNQGSTGRIIPSSELKRFQKEISDVWYKNNKVAAHKCRSKIREWMVKGNQIQIAILGMWNFFDLFTQDGTPKRMDVSNRMKALHDSLSEIMEIDDSWYWSVSAHKIEIKSSVPWVAVIYKPVTHVSLADLKEKKIL